MFNLPLELILEVLSIIDINILINYSLINKKSYNLFIKNKNYIGIRKLKTIKLYLLIKNYNYLYNRKYQYIYDRLLYIV